MQLPILTPEKQLEAYYDSLKSMGFSPYILDKMFLKRLNDIQIEALLKRNSEIKRNCPEYRMNMMRIRLLKRKN